MFKPQILIFIFQQYLYAGKCYENGLQYASYYTVI